MIDRIKVDEKMKKFVEDTCDEYRTSFKKHRKNVSHMSKNGNFVEWENYKYVEGVKEI
ncbi:MAG: hypothetical protein IKN74_00870 [Clostridia bacterium]|nr:hypothetical protein [Bacilli bacterium]MBR3511494.1 hypothetical protein [Clostridia bacterium]